MVIVMVAFGKWRRIRGWMTCYRFMGHRFAFHIINWMVIESCRHVFLCFRLNRVSPYKTFFLIWKWTYKVSFNNNLANAISFFDTGNNERCRCETPIIPYFYKLHLPTCEMSFQRFCVTAPSLGIWRGESGETAVRDNKIHHLIFGSWLRGLKKC